MTRAYGAILADPPWRFTTRSAKGKGRSPEAWYACMSLDEIKALPVGDLAAADCGLFLWSTNPMLPQALEVMAAWGFAFKGVGFTWAKLTKHGKWHFGLGYLTRQNTERVLYGTRGRPKRQARDVPELLVAPVREHSRKPREARERIERLLPGPYVELFAREVAPGWDTAHSDQLGAFAAQEGPPRRRWGAAGPGIGTTAT